MIVISLPQGFKSGFYIKIKGDGIENFKISCKKNQYISFFQTKTSKESGYIEPTNRNDFVELQLVIDEENKENFKMINCSGNWVIE